jgi:hypothetical protein
MGNRISIFWIAFAFVALILTIPVGISINNNYKVFKNGTIKDVVIKSLPNANSTSGSFMKFYLNENVYSKKVYGSFGLYHKIGDTIQLKYLAGYEHYFLFPNEQNPLIWGTIGLGMLIISASFCFFYAYKKTQVKFRV